MLEIRRETTRIQGIPVFQKQFYKERKSLRHPYLGAYAVCCGTAEAGGRDANCSSMDLMLCSISVNWHLAQSQTASGSGINVSHALIKREDEEDKVKSGPRREDYGPMHEGASETKRSNINKNILRV